MVILRDGRASDWRNVTFCICEKLQNEEEIARRTVSEVMKRIAEEVARIMKMTWVMRTRVEEE
jgi:hypothetical protein